MKVKCTAEMLPPLMKTKLQLHKAKKKKKKSCVALGDQPIFKNKINKIRVENAPNFCQIGCFFTFFKEKRWKMHQNFFYFWVPFKNNNNKFLKIPTDRPQYSEIPLEGNTEFFFSFFLFLPKCEFIM